MADRIVILSAGRVIREGTLEQLLADGGDSHGLTFGAPPGLDVTSLAAALGAGALVTETAPGRYRIEGASGPEATAVLATWLAERGATLTDLATGRSLEDVYFAAVGAAAADQPEATAVPGGRGRRGRPGGGGGRPSGRRPR
jgi:ABC-2 type transport system ATP-binding protein